MRRSAAFVYRTRENYEMADNTPKPITIDELEVIAKQKLPQNVYDYYACGSDDQKCLRRNREAFDRCGRCASM